MKLNGKTINKLFGAEARELFMTWTISFKNRYRYKNRALFDEGKSLISPAEFLAGIKSNEPDAVFKDVIDFDMLISVLFGKANLDLLNNAEPSDYNAYVELIKCQLISVNPTFNVSPSAYFGVTLDNAEPVKFNKTKSCVVYQFFGLNGYIIYRCLSKKAKQVYNVMLSRANLQGHKFVSPSEFVRRKMYGLPFSHIIGHADSESVNYVDKYLMSYSDISRILEMSIDDVKRIESKFISLMRSVISIDDVNDYLRLFDRLSVRRLVVNEV